MCSDNLKNDLNNINRAINFLTDFIRAIIYRGKHFDNSSLAADEETVTTRFSVVLFYYAFILPF